MLLPLRRSAGAPLLLAAILALTACGSEAPSSATPTPSAPAPTIAATPTPEPTTEPTPTPVPEVEVPLALVTGYTSVDASVTFAEVEAAATAGELLVPCEVTFAFGRSLASDRDCRTAEELRGDLVAGTQGGPMMALLPPSLVTPDVKVLPVDGADVFGDAEARAMEYPIMGRAIGVEPFDPSEIRTLMSLGDSCPDRGVAHAAITLGRGWEWVFGGGTAAYTAVYPNPVPEGFVGNGFNIVDAVPTGNEGAVAELVSGADVTLDDFECPVVDDWTVNEGVVFSIDPAVLPHLRDTYGVDVATLAANHLFDRGTPGFLQTLEKFSQAGIPTAGAGVDLDAALEPALVDASGMTFAFVAFNEIPGSLEAGPGQPGVLWLRDENVVEAVSRARAADADVVICVPQWWGGAEYHAQFIGDMRRQQQVFFDAGCDHVLGHGTHWSGPIEITSADDGDYRVTMVSHGNFLFGQEWSQQTQEGVLLELAFQGTRLAQARMHPYIMLEQAQTNLTDPETEGRYVLERIYEASGLGSPSSP
jgi:poly-gamma-glutamate capsule biosynthesis protein CapA/YwtB (metallophosphatase superfamily)